ncbi:MAG TPA: hypothetical protein VFC19_54715 [Candidatus Limnocylindrales bacterium]|nr:hypothetical protein [Candidatus Limnocylindrales bacterium]
MISCSALVLVYQPHPPIVLVTPLKEKEASQLQVIQILARLAELGVPAQSITLICIGEHPGIARFGGLGELTAEQLRELPATNACARLSTGSATLALLLFGGCILYLGFQAWFYRVATRHAWGRRVIACLACAGAGVTALWLPPLVSLALLDIILITLAVVLSRVHQRLDNELRAT